MGRKIMVINPWGVDYMDRVTEEIIGAHLRPDTDVACTSLGDSAPPLPWPAAESKDVVVHAACKAQADGFDAVIIGCAADPFLADVRAAVSVPVIAPTEAACITARSRGKLTILARQLSDDYLPLIPTQGNWDFWLDKAREYGLGSTDFSLRRVFVPNHPDPDSLTRLTRDDPDRLRDIMLEAMRDSLHEQGLTASRAAAQDDDADVVFFACAFWSQSIAALGANTERYGVAIINPLVSAGTFAEQQLLAVA